MASTAKMSEKQMLRLSTTRVILQTRQGGQKQNGLSGERSKGVHQRLAIVFDTHDDHLK